MRGCLDDNVPLFLGAVGDRKRVLFNFGGASLDLLQLRMECAAQPRKQITQLVARGLTGCAAPIQHHHHRLKLASLLASIGSHAFPTGRDLTDPFAGLVEFC